VIGSHPTAPWTGTLAPDLTRIVETEIAPASIKAMGGGKYLVDIGKLQSGMPKIRFSGGEAGTVVAMRGGEVLDAAGEIPPGTKSQSTEMEFLAILSGKPFIFEPVEYLGMRWFQIDNAPMPVTRENFSFIVRHSVLDENASAFESSDPAVNAVWEFMKHSLFTCAQEAFVDTPTREKGGFLGDAAIQSIVAMPVLHERALTQRTLGEYLQSMDQYWSSPDKRGRMNAVYPNNDSGRDIPDYTLSYLPWVWSYYMETGDRAFLAVAWEKLRDIGAYIERHTDANTGLVTNLTGGAGPYEFGIIDWPATMRFGYDMDTAARTVVNGWAFAAYEALAKISGELGKAEDQAGYHSKAAALAQAINSRLIGSGGIYVDGLQSGGSASSHASQHASMFPLALGIVPEENRAAVIGHVKAKGMSVGMVTVLWLVRALGEAGEGPALLDLFTNKKQAGWARCLELGATATWESWDADTTGQSMSHAWGAAGLDGYVRYILGIRPLEPQYSDVLIQPLDFGDKLDSAEGKITTDRGEIAVQWKRAEKSHRIRVSLPANVTARVALPRGTAAQPVVRLNGKPVASTLLDGFLVVSGVGSGQHTLVRHDP
jgi:alpha-L-rhamnosidase